MFGGRIFGGGQFRRQKASSEIGMPDAHEPRMEGEVMMCWFLRRWGPISEGLFDVIEDAKMGTLQDQRQDRRRSLEKTSSVLMPLGNSVGNGAVANHGRDTSFKPHSCEGMSCASSDSPKFRPGSIYPRVHDENPSKIGLDPPASKNNDSDKHEDDSGEVLDRGMSIPLFLSFHLLTKIKKALLAPPAAR